MSSRQEPLIVAMLGHITQLAGLAAGHPNDRLILQELEGIRETFAKVLTVYAEDIASFGTRIEEIRQKFEVEPLSKKATRLHLLTLTDDSREDDN